ncbi:MAG: hypothetical protein ACWGNV_10185 [Bacteroidales bacterium]
MIDLKKPILLADLSGKLERFWQVSADKIHLLMDVYDQSKGSPVFTIEGKYATRGWTEWTQGFQYGSEILQFDATGDNEILRLGRVHTLQFMAPHISHTGVHDHGFNNISTYGNLLRIMLEGRLEYNEWERHFYELALKASAAVQASRWTPIPEGGFIYSFNGPHSLFVDTIRTVRVLMVGHLLGHVLYGENDRRISLMGRALKHAEATAKYAVYYGEGRDVYDVWGRTAHESVFNTTDGHYRSPNAQQGYSAFTTWTRGLAWAMCGFAEELELLERIPDQAFQGSMDRERATGFMLRAARATCDFYIGNTPVDGIPYWDTGAPQLHRLGNFLDRPADPFNDAEPVDSSAAAIGAQGLLRLGRYLKKSEPELSGKYLQCGLKILDRLLDEPYLSSDPDHQGLLLHSIYHRPNGWDHVPEGSKIPFGESSMWGDYHLRELALYVQRMIRQEPYYTFYGCIENI